MADAAAARPFSLAGLAYKLVGRAVVYALFPVMLSQAFALRRHALTLVPAAGPPAGGIGRGDSLHFLAIGDSIVAGVGARRVERSTVVHVARFLSGRLAREINWHAAGIIGAGARRVRRDAVPQLPPHPFDAILLSVGVNDVLRASTAVLDAEANRTAAIVDVMIADAMLRRAVGRVPQ